MCAVEKLLRVAAFCFVVAVVNAQLGYLGTKPSPRLGIEYGNCIVPENFENSQWVSLNKRVYNPGETVPTFTYLKISCFKGYRTFLTYAMKQISCLNGEWIGLFTGRTCYKSSYSNPEETYAYNSGKNYKRQQTETTPIAENTENTPLDTSENNIKKTSTVSTLYPSEDLYKSTESSSRIVFRDDDKAESLATPESTKSPVYFPTATPDISNLQEETPPWHVSLYKIRHSELICSGSLISQRVIISAAHCVTDPKGELMAKNLYRVAVGKDYIKYNDARDQTQKKFYDIKDMFAPENYRGEIQNFVGDILLIITNTSVTLSTKVRPINLDYTSMLDKNLFNPEKTPYGFLSGWGYTHHDVKPSEKVKTVKVLPINLRTCSSHFTREYQIYMTHDKMCTKYFDKDMDVCRGNNGGGFAVKQNDMFYLAGVVSLIGEAPTVVGGCYSQKHVLITRVEEYSDFIYGKVNYYKQPPIGHNHTIYDLRRQDYYK